MIRVVLAVVFATALLGASLPAAERAERDRNAALAVAELDRVAAAAEELEATNDPADDGAAVVVELHPPTPSLTNGGRIVVTDDRLRWWPDAGTNRTVDPSTTLRTDETLVLTSRTRLRLTLIGSDGEPTVRIERANVEIGSRSQTAHALSIA